MFFTLSKTLNYLATPLVLVMLLLIASVIFSRHRKRLFWCGIGLLFFFSNEFMANAIMRWWEVDPIPYASMDTSTYKVGVVLTGVTSHRMVPDDRVYFQRGADRVTHTVQLYKMKIIRKILVSGGSGRLIDNEEREADDFLEAMMLMGVPREDILIERDTRNTHESAVAVKKMLDSDSINYSHCLLITSGFHMRRSLACYRKEGMNIVPFSTDFYAQSPEYTLDVFIIPKLDAMVIWQKLLKEWVGMTAYWMVGYI